MSAQEEIPRIDSELEEARRAFQETILQVNRKVRTIEDRFSPELLVRRHPVTLSCAAAALGFLMGSWGERTTAEAFILGGLFVGAVRMASEQ